MSIEANIFKLVEYTNNDRRYKLMVSIKSLMTFPVKNSFHAIKKHTERKWISGMFLVDAWKNSNKLEISI